MKSSYSNDEVQILLKDITGLVEPLPASIREKFIQSGMHYCEMLPVEYKPSKQYMNAYKNALKVYSKSTARAIGILSEKIYKIKGRSTVIVSLARAGIPAGILIKRYLKNKYGADIKHYAISIIRGRGIDKNAIKYILCNHDANSIQFIDGWIGKGAILGELHDAMIEFPNISCELGVISDPANITKLCGTYDDILIPSACLNATVTGLISRTFLREDIIGIDDFHGAAFYSDLLDEDMSIEFLNAIESNFEYDYMGDNDIISSISGIETVNRIAEYYRVKDINFIKPGIGETTRVLLRRVPWKIIINEKYVDSVELNHIYQLADEKNVSVDISCVPLGNYKACGIIKNLSDV